MKLIKNLMKVHVKATTINMKTGGVMYGEYVVYTNGFMGVADALKAQIGKNERIEHMEVL